VRKIQTALNALSSGPRRENFDLKVDGIYGPKTAAAVKAYKAAPQRRILGPGQTTPDDIVGKRTIKSLDDEMEIKENESPAITTSLIAFDPFGAKHEHSKCPPPSVDKEIEIAPDGTMSHIATPLNPLRFGRMVNIGGIFEASYLGFQDFVPDPRLDRDMPVDQVKGRPFTTTLRDHSVSDICFRSAPLDPFMQKELLRICARGARLTVAGDESQRTLDFIRSIGLIIETGTVVENQGQPNEKEKNFIIATVLNVNP
jgi:hypothetical protein